VKGAGAVRIHEITCDVMLQPPAQLAGKNDTWEAMHAAVDRRPHISIMGITLSTAFHTFCWFPKLSRGKAGLQHQRQGRRKKKSGQGNNAHLIRRIWAAVSFFF